MVIIAAVLAINGLTGFLFWHDKRCARTGGWRVPEALLLGCALVGGSPAAWLAMRVLRHKTRKTSFRVRFWLVAAAQASVLAYLIAHPGGLPARLIAGPHH